MWSKLDVNIYGIGNYVNFLRLPLHKAFLKALLSPLVLCYDDWYKMRQDHLYKLNHNAQICYFEKSLNDTFDNELRRIYIGNGNAYDPEYIYTPAEEQPKFLGTLFLHSSDDYADTGVDYIVFVPAEIIATSIFALEAHINFYNEGVKRYKIEDI